MVIIKVHISRAKFCVRKKRGNKKTHAYIYKGNIVVDKNQITKEIVHICKRHWQGQQS